MTTPATPMYVSRVAQDGFLQMKSSYIESFAAYENLRQQMIDIDIAYMREKDQTQANQRAKLMNRAGDVTKFQNITVPIIYPQVESAVEYQTEVFLSGYPIFTYTAPPAQIDAAQMMNVIMADNSTRGGWVIEFMKAFRDGFKYNLMAMECDWEQCTVPVLETDITKSKTEGTPKEIIWSGNVVKRIDLYNSFWDKRYSPCDMSARGEFFGYHKLMSRTEMKSFINGLDCKIIANIVPALESMQQGWGTTQNNILTYSIPQIRQDVTALQESGAEPDWNRWVLDSQGKDGTEYQIQYRNSYVVTILYARIIPADFNLKVPSSQTPQIWKFYWVNNTILLGCKRMTNAHQMLPILMAQPLDDGLAYQTKSFANNVEDIQDVSSAMINSVIAARRRAISDRTLYDPSRITEAQINSPNPSAKIPVRPAAYGKNISESVYAFPFRDDQSGIILQELNTVMQLGDYTNGQNKTRRGQFQKGNKTLEEFQTVDDNSTGRDKMCSIGLEATLMTPMKVIMTSNILQYQGVGQIFSKDLKENVNIDPVKLRNSVLSFNLSDGLIPSSKVLNVPALQAGLQTMASVPQLAAGYNLAPMFSYLMKSQNADLTAFEKPPQQVAFEQANAQWNQLAQLSIQKGVEFKLPQPTPQAYGYDPTASPQSPPVNPAVSPALSSTNTPPTNPSQGKQSANTAA